MADPVLESAASPQAPDPTKLVPVTAQDVERARRRWVMGILSAALVVSGAVWYTYQRQVDPIQAKMAYDAGVRLFQATRYDQAILNFDRAIDLEADFADAYLMRARSSVAVYKPESAIPDFTKVAALRPDDAVPLVERGFAYLGQKNWARAVDDATHALALDPKFGRAYNLHGNAVRAQGNVQKALEDFTLAVEYEPNLDNYFQRASTYQLLEKHQLAIADFDQAVALSPDQPHTYFARALSRMIMGDNQGARDDIKTGRKIDGW